MKNYLWSFAGLFLLLIAFAYFSGMDPVSLVGSIVSFYTTQNLALVSGFTFTQTITIILQLTLILAVVIFSIGLVCERKTVKTKDINAFQFGPIFAYVLITLEELIRILFVLVIPSWFGGGFTATVVCMTIGNILWTALHIPNFTGPLVHKIIHIGGIFAAGFVLGPMLIRYGFWITLLVHYSYDSLVWALRKEHDTKAANLLIFIYWLVVVVIMGIIFHASSISFSMLIPLFNSLIMPAGGNVWVIIALMIGSYTVSGLIMSALNFDFVANYKNTREKLGQSNRISIIVFVIFYIIGLSIIILMISGLSWILMHWIENPLIIAVVTSSIVVLLDQPKTGSAMSCLWFTDIPMTFLMVFIILTYGFLPSLLILSVSGIFTVVPSVIRMLAS